MLLIKPSYEIIDCPEREVVLKKIEKVGRTCYKSEEKITDDSASRFVRMLVKNRHEAMIEHESITVKFITNRSVSHELVRHRLASFGQESQRYVSYNKKGIQFVIPDWTKGVIAEGEYKECPFDYFPDVKIWFDSLLQAERNYNNLINLKWKPEQARDILPNATKTEIVVTANLREWRHIFQLRTTPQAFSQMRQVMIPLLQELQEKLPEIFEDINLDE